MKPEHVFFLTNDFIILLSITLKGVGYHHAKLIIFLHIILDGLCKIFVFLIWSLNFFYPGILILIEDQLLLIFYEMVKLKEEGSR
jgi:hypothetical protein